MKPVKLSLSAVRLLVVLALLLVSQPFALAAWPNDHLNLADIWVADILPENNLYGSPASIYYDANGQLHATCMCNHFVNLLLRNAYPTVTTSVLQGLTGSTSPTAAKWHDAIMAENTYTNADGTFTLYGSTNILDLSEGDILAAKYSTGSGHTGHVMVVDSFWASPTLPNTFVVRIYDATQDIHGNRVGSTDTRYAAQDSGIGSGDIHVYVAADGTITGWAWSTTTSIVYQTTDPNAPYYRPLVIGSLTGPGL